jgi:hypothetical protein
MEGRERAGAENQRKDEGEGEREERRGKIKGG